MKIMNKRKLFWIEYIELYCIENGLTGLTIPNIIGSVRLNTSFKDYSINDFLTEVINEEYEIIISNCTDLDEIVIGKFKGWNAPKSYYENIGSIYYSKNDFKIENFEFKDLVDVLEFRYNSKINNEKYSKDLKSNSWLNLTLEDKQNHMKVIEKLRIK